MSDVHRLQSYLNELWSLQSILPLRMRSSFPQVELLQDSKQLCGRVIPGMPPQAYSAYFRHTRLLSADILPAVQRFQDCEDESLPRMEARRSCVCAVVADTPKVCESAVCFAL